jgi:hypothetical protein
LSFHLAKQHTNKYNGERDNKAGEKRETRTDKHKEERGKKWLWKTLFKFLIEKRRFGSGGFIFNVADSYFIYGQTWFNFHIIMRQF